ncbi:Eco57I restriction-modification methylase domain-containing protein [Vulcanococcus limneticus]|uniref:Eco57I restriction-modification methylase domain-containing protein n=1 Tax=Vulcanococcus limneticus TaxID=2170428 RepID=UPI00398BF057
MGRRRSATLQFNAIQLVGGLLPASLLEQIALQQASGQKASAYGLPKNQRLQVAVDQAWSRAKALWQEAQELRRRGDDMPWAPWFSQRLLQQVFGWDDLTPCPPRQIEAALFPITHQAFSGAVPVVFTSLGNDDLDKGHKQFGQEGRKRSPHSCLQECLNADDSANWGVLCNGTTLRLLHDNPALVKPAYVAVALDQLFEGGLFDEFAVVWLLLHASRFQRKDDGACVLDGWKQEGQQSGERALNKLRDGVQAALEAVGQGVLQHPANGELVHKLHSGELSTQDFFRQLLRLVYRLLFLCVAEDRNLLFPPDVPLELRQIYREGYSLSRLRDLAIRSGAHEHQHGDLWRVQTLVLAELGRGGSSLGLPGLGGLFDEKQCPDLDSAQLSNAALLEAVRAIGWFYDEQSQSRTRINYQALNTEEFGSVYESLLELHPQISGSGASLRFSLGGVAGSERKTSGSYYTPEELVRLLILSALLPVIRDRLSNATTQEEKAAALLAIRVLDPACGSGHFLLAAARRLALELARIQAGDDEPSEDLRRHCLRQVVAHCIYGVDKNPMAVELCKVALWIEAIEPGKPLGFLDAHIQCGDSLVGVFDPMVLDGGIPDGAYKPLTGDNKTICTSLKKQNQAFVVQGQADLFSAAAMAQAIPSATGFEAIEEDDLQAVRRKEQAYQAWRADPAIRQELQRADAYAAAFFLPKEPGVEQLVPLSQHLEALKQGAELSAAMAEAVEKAGAEFRFLHWHLAFPEAMQAGGFDCVLGNPPWERIKLQEKEFFAARSEAIATAPNKAARERLIQALRAAEASSADRQLVREFELAKREAEGSGEFIRGSGRFALTAVGDLNTYALFAELFLNLVGPKGRAGVIVPTGIATDNSTKAYFDAISRGGRLVNLYDFENRHGLFPAVDSRMKFALLTLGNGVQATDFVFFATAPQQLAESRRHFNLSADDIALINPNTRTCPVFRSQIDAELAKKIYRRVPLLIDEALAEQGNPWGIRFMRMLDMSNDSHLFFEEPARDRLPLYEAKLIHHYDHRWATYSPDGSSSDVALADKQDPEFQLRPRYWVNREEVSDRLSAQGWGQQWLMGWRDICRGTDERTVICSVVPMAGIGNQMPLMLPEVEASTDSAALLLGNLTSIPYDFFARHKVGGTHMNFFIYKQLPVLPPGAYSQDAIDFIQPRVLQLTYTSHDLKSWAEDLSYDGPPFAFDLDRRALLRAELDAYYAHLYGLNRDELRYILDPADVMGPDYPSETFRVLKNNEVRQFGEYRTQRLVLEAWDRLFGAEARASNLFTT